MCSPMAALAIGGSLLSVAQTMSVASKNRAAEQDWMDYQRRKRREEQTRQDQLRRKAEAARLQGQERLDLEGQQKTLSQDQQRLKDYIGVPTGDETLDPAETAAATPGLLGQSNVDLTQDYVSQRNAASLAEATREANRRIAALADLSSYGNLGLSNVRDLRRGAQGIEQYGNYRKGSLAVHELAKNVQPVRYQPGFDFGGALAGLAGRFI